MHPIRQLRGHRELLLELCHGRYLSDSVRGRPTRRVEQVAGPAFVECHAGDKQPDGELAAADGRACDCEGAGVEGVAQGKSGACKAQRVKGRATGMSI
jgi:hypothetical protein